jgi:hypothetical protein
MRLTARKFRIGSWLVEDQGSHLTARLASAAIQGEAANDAARIHGLLRLHNSGLSETG